MTDIAWLFRLFAGLLLSVSGVGLALGAKDEAKITALWAIAFAVMANW